MHRIFRPFRLQSPSVAPTAWPVFHSRTYRRSHSSERHPPTKQGNAGVSWASPLGCRLAATIGRIEFVILRTSRSPPDALHLPSRGRSFDRLRQPGRPPTGTHTLLVRYTCNRTAPGGSPGTPGMHAIPPPMPCWPTPSLGTTAAVAGEGTHAVPSPAHFNRPRCPIAHGS
jgi:hypothetical protein